MLQATHNMQNILFICEGNVGRSQMAEAFYNFYTKTQNAQSAGLDKTTPMRYKFPTQTVIDVMKKEGIDISKNKVKHIDNIDLTNFEKIIVLGGKNNYPKHLIDSKITEFWQIEDPFLMNEEKTRRIKNIINKLKKNKKEI